jgi:hypothetical protein
MRLILHRTVGADNAPPGPARWGCRRLLPICRPDGPENPSSHRESLTRPKNISKHEFVGCRRLLPIDCRDGPQSVHANLLSCLSSTFAVIASESTKQAARFPADQPQKHSLFVL